MKNDKKSYLVISSDTAIAGMSHIILAKKALNTKVDFYVSLCFRNFSKDLTIEKRASYKYPNDKVISYEDQ